MSKKVALILAEGFEEIEAVTPVDVLRRAGLNLVLVGLSGKTVTGAHGLKVDADLMLSDLADLPDAIILPGGMPGSKNLAASEPLKDLICRMKEADKTIGAICAAPALVLSKTGVLDQKSATCYPGFENNFGEQIKFSEDKVVVDGSIITSRGPGTALDFSLALVEKLVSSEKAEELRAGLLASLQAVSDRPFNCFG